MSILQAELRSKNVKVNPKYGIDVINGKIADLSAPNKTDS